MDISEKLRKLFYRCFYILCLLIFVLFPVQHYIQNFGHNDMFWWPIIRVLAYFLPVLLIGLFVQILINREKKYVAYIAPLVVFAAALYLHLSAVLDYGANTTQISDFGQAVIVSQQPSPLYNDWYRVFSNWAVYVRTLDLVQKIFGTGVSTVLVVNAFLYAFSTVLIYWIVSLSNIQNKHFVGFVASGFYAVWPSCGFWSLIASPDYWHIVTLLLALLLVEIAVQCSVRWWAKVCLITAASLLMVLSDFYKSTAKIMLIALVIAFILFAIRWLQNQVFTKNNTVRKGMLLAALKKVGVYALLFLAVFLLGQKGIYKMLDQYIGYTVNRNPSPHFMYIGLHSGSMGSWTPEHGGHYYALVTENEFDFDAAAEIIGEEIRADVEANDHWNPYMFFAKAKRAFSGEDYLEFIEMTLDPDGKAMQEGVLDKQASFINCYYLVVGNLVAWGIYKLRDKEHPLCFVSALYITGFVLSMLLLENQPRYKIVVYPYMCILAAYAFSTLPDTVFKHGAKKA